MNEAANKMKQQVVDKIKGTTNILITVSKDPSVDELSAALGLTALLNKIDKHATAIFSGILPPAITFLEPDKIFENNADSLRDFIIALDKEKADHLRYKIEGDVVKIFITPYRTTITKDDLEFSEGDYNIELVLALGVMDQEHLDTTLASQEKIMHDVTIMTLSAGEQTSQLGSIDWHDENASGYSEMVVGIAEAITTADKPLLDKQISTALLTGIVSVTDRFSNDRTSPQVMAMSAQLMAAGADQQLIATKLRDSHEINSLPTAAKDEADVSTDEASKAANTVDLPPTEDDANKKPQEPGTLQVPHDVSEEDEDTTRSDKPELTEPEPTQEPQTLSPESVEEKESDKSFDVPKPPKRSVGKAKSEVADEPLLGGILNATSEQAAEDAKRELDEQQNKTILAHSYLKGSGDNQINSSTNLETEDKPIDIFANTAMTDSVPQVDNLPLPPPLPDFSNLPPSSTLSPTPPVSNEPSVEPTSKETENTLPPEKPADEKPSTETEKTDTSTSTLPPNNLDPSQFQIPS